MAKLNGRWEVLSTDHVGVFESTWRQYFTWTNSHVSVRHVMEEKCWPEPTCCPGSAYLLCSPYLLELLSVSQSELTAIICQLHLCISKPSVTFHLLIGYGHTVSDSHIYWRVMFKLPVKTGSEVNPFLKIVLRNTSDHRWQIIMNIKPPASLIIIHAVC